jgi:hypothetical protein
LCCGARLCTAPTHLQCGVPLLAWHDALNDPTTKHGVCSIRVPSLEHPPPNEHRPSKHTTASLKGTVLKPRNHMHWASSNPPTATQARNQLPWVARTTSCTSTVHTQTQQLQNKASTRVHTTRQVSGAHKVSRGPPTEHPLLCLRRHALGGGPHRQHRHRQDLYAKLPNNLPTSRQPHATPLQRRHYGQHQTLGHSSVRATRRIAGQACTTLTACTTHQPPGSSEAQQDQGEGAYDPTKHRSETYCEARCKQGTLQPVQSVRLRGGSTPCSSDP